MKRAVLLHLRGRGVAVPDLGTDRTAPVDYPDVPAPWRSRYLGARPTPVSSSTARTWGRPSPPTRWRGPRGDVPDETIARYSRQHNGANVLTLGSTLVAGTTALRIVDIWLGTAMREARYIRRLAKIKGSRARRT